MIVYLRAWCDQMIPGLTVWTSLEAGVPVATYKSHNHEVPARQGTSRVFREGNVRQNKTSSRIINVNHR
jgi:hypothetical protein